MGGRYMTIAKQVNLPDGPMGVRAVLGLMRKLIIEGALALPVREAAIQVVSDIAPNDEDGEIRAIADFVRAYVRYVGEPGELVQGAPYTLRVRAGDCDDMVVLAGAMLRAIGYVVKLVAVGMEGERGYSHVFLGARSRSNTWRWVELLRNWPVGERVRSAREMTVLV